MRHRFQTTLVSCQDTIDQMFCLFKVFRGYLVYQLCSIGPIVENNDKVRERELVVGKEKLKINFRRTAWPKKNAPHCPPKGKYEEVLEDCQRSERLLRYGDRYAFMPFLFFSVMLIRTRGPFFSMPNSEFRQKWLNWNEFVPCDICRLRFAHIWCVVYDAWLVTYVLTAECDHPRCTLMSKQTLAKVARARF